MTPRHVRADSLRLEVFHHLFAATAEEMGVTLMRSAFSPNIKERRDFSCALFDAEGRMIAQAAHLPVHLGSAPLSLAAVRETLVLEPGDVAVVNDPYQGGTHLPDLTFVVPVFLTRSRAPDLYCLNRAHHADVGGANPGSMAPAFDVHGEGLRIPPIKLVRAGKPDQDLMRLLLANMRVSAERRADLLAQEAACAVGERRLRALAVEYGPAEVRRRAGELMDWTESLMASVVSGLPRGDWTFEDELENVGGRPIVIRLRLRSGGDRLEFDFRATDDQVAGPVNTVRAVVVSAVFYVLRSLLPGDVPTNDGILRRSRILTRPGSVIDARYPAPVAAGNVETSQRLVDVLFGVLAQLIPERIPAASAGTMSNLTFGSAAVAAVGSDFTYYETIAGGAGGGPLGAGEHGVQTHMTNTRNTPIEALEGLLPVRILAYDLRRGSGGSGQHRGGDGVRKRLRFLAPAQVGWVAERQEKGPWGLAGGARGSVGGARLHSPGRKGRPLSGKASLHVDAGDEIEVWTPGGGGWGSARA